MTKFGKKTHKELCKSCAILDTYVRCSLLRHSAKERDSVEEQKSKGCMSVLLSSSLSLSLSLSLSQGWGPGRMAEGEDCSTISDWKESCSTLEIGRAHV